MVQLPQSFTGGQATLVPPAAEAHWLAADVVARHEKAVAEQLALRAVDSFLPLYRSLRYWKNRRAQVELPLFPSYLLSASPVPNACVYLRFPVLFTSRPFRVRLSRFPTRKLQVSALRSGHDEPSPSHSWQAGDVYRSKRVHCRVSKALCSAERIRRESSFR